MKKLTGKLVVGVFAVLLAAISGPAMAKDSSEPIVIPTHNWSSQSLKFRRWIIGLITSMTIFPFDGYLRSLLE